jgi:hypothetical protein
MVEAYSFKEKKMVHVHNAHVRRVKTERGVRYMVKGKGPKGENVAGFISKDAAEKMHKRHHKEQPERKMKKITPAKRKARKAKK